MSEQSSNKFLSYIFSIFLYIDTTLGSIKFQSTIPKGGRGDYIHVELDMFTNKFFIKFDAAGKYGN